MSSIAASSFVAAKRLLGARRRDFTRRPGAQLDNLYGPTEATIDVTHLALRECNC